MFSDKLNGKVVVSQQNATVDGKYVSNMTAVNHTIVLKEADKAFLEKNATSVFTYWFVDCVYYGLSKEMSFAIQFAEVDTVHNVEVLVVAGKY